jgi:hypothetical protein
MSGTWTAPKTYGSNVLTSGEKNTYERDNMLYLKTHISLEAAGALTINAGAVTMTQGYHKIAGEGAAADDLDTISGGSEGDVIIIRANGQVITLKDAVDNLDLDGVDIVLYTDDEHIALIYGDDSNWHPISGVYREHVIMADAFQYPAPGTDWTPQVEGAGLAQNLAAKKCWIPLNFLKIGDKIVSYNLVGDATEAAALTLDCKLVRVNKADPLTTTDVAGGAITQIDADGDFDSLATLTAVETVATDKQYTLEVEGTTGAGDSITVIGAEVTVRRVIG